MKRFSIWSLTIAYEIIQLYRRIFQPITLGVRVILINNDNLLFVKHTYMYQDKWYFPGGGLKPGESPEQAARREAREEVGADLGELRLIGVYPNQEARNSDNIIVFSCSNYSLPQEFHKNNRNLEIASSQNFQIQNLPTNLAAGHQRWIEDCLQQKAILGFTLG